MNAAELDIIGQHGFELFEGQPRCAWDLHELFPDMMDPRLGGEPILFARVELGLGHGCNRSMNQLGERLGFRGDGSDDRRASDGLGHHLDRRRLRASAGVGRGRAGTGAADPGPRPDRDPGCPQICWRMRL